MRGRRHARGRCAPAHDDARVVRSGRRRECAPPDQRRNGTRGNCGEPYTQFAAANAERERDGAKSAHHPDVLIGAKRTAIGLTGRARCVQQANRTESLCSCFPSLPASSGLGPLSKGAALFFSVNGCARCRAIDKALQTRNGGWSRQSVDNSAYARPCITSMFYFFLARSRAISR